MTKGSHDRDGRGPVIPIFRPSITEEEIAEVTAVLRSGWLGSGPQVQLFENAFADSVGAARAISTCNGTSALAATLAGLGVGPGDEIILPSFTFVSAFQVIRSFGAIPVFADIEPRYLTLDPGSVQRRIGPRTKGIIAVHHGGQVADVEAISKLADEAGIWLVDDAAHAAGARLKGRAVGSLCRATVFSFNAVKNLCTGDGGMVTTADPDLANRIATFRSLGINQDTWARYGRRTDRHQSRWTYLVEDLGQRLHMNDLAAAIGLVQLRRLPELNRLRAQRVADYERAFLDIGVFESVKARPDTAPSWHMYTVLMDERDAFLERMRALGVCVGVHYCPIHLFPVAEPFRSELPVTERLWRKVTTFPLYPSMTADEQNRVIEAAYESASVCRPPA